MSDRPSRQDLVVPPKRSNLGIVLGALASVALGFAAVWTSGIGRTHTAAMEPFTLPGTTVDEASVDTDRPEKPHRFSPAPAREADPGDRYGIQSTAFESSSHVVQAAGEEVRMSRFSRTENPSTEPISTGEPADLEPPPDAAEPSTVGTEEDLAPAAEASAAPTTPPTPTDLDPEPAADTAAVRPRKPAAEPARETDLPPSALPPPDDAADLAAPPPSAAPPAAFPQPARPPEAAARIPAAGVAPPAVGTNPLRGPTATLAAAIPYAAAPPIAPPAVGAPAVTPTRTSGHPSAISSGQGRPGPVQLEGLQAPQLTVEKRGPREVQVGKAARYEILVRNVGSAVAHDVMLRDSVPYGAALVTTTPPASPVNQAADGPPGDLAWMLGSLPPGGQARVAMEVMPKLEGDIGSVASVTFRADASLRSRATKPDLRLDAADPKPVLIGREVKLPITITNPGTGVATGVVLEGLLPDPLTHRAGKELEFDVGQLQPGGSRTLDLSLGSTGPGVHTIRLVARADGQIEVERILKVEITAPTLELEAEMPARRYLQRPAVCLISMANTGTAPAKSVELAAQLPPGVKFVRANNAGYYDERTHRVLWNLEELPAAERGTVELVVMPIDLGPQKIVAAARSADGLSDQVSHTIEVEGLAAVTFEVTDSEDPIEVSGLTEYVIRVGNQGTKAASGVRLSATILGEMEPVEAKGPAAHRIDNLTVSFEPLARLAPTEEAVYRIRVRGHRAGDQRVQVQLTSDDHPAPITKEEITRVYADR